MPVPGQAIIPGIGDLRTQRANVALDGFEPRPPIEVLATPATAGTGEAITLSCPEPFRLRFESEVIGVLPGTGTIRFDEAGSYLLEVQPTDPFTTSIQGTLSITVTPGGTPVATDLVVPERRTSLAAEVRAKLPDFDLGISRAQAREAAAEEIRTRTITTQAQAVQAIRDLAAIERQTNNDFALMVGYIRRVSFALVEIATRRG